MVSSLKNSNPNRKELKPNQFSDILELSFFRRRNRKDKKKCSENIQKRSKIYEKRSENSLKRSINSKKRSIAINDLKNSVIEKSLKINQSVPKIDSTEKVLKKSAKKSKNGTVFEKFSPHKKIEHRTLLGKNRTLLVSNRTEKAYYRTVLPNSGTLFRNSVINNYTKNKVKSDENKDKIDGILGKIRPFLSKINKILGKNGSKDYLKNRGNYYLLAVNMIQNAKNKEEISYVESKIIKRDPSFIGNTYGYCLEYAPLDYVIVLITKAIWEAYKSIKGDEKVIYGPFFPDEIYLLPKEEAEFLVNEGYAKQLSKGEVELMLKKIENKRSEKYG